MVGKIDKKIFKQQNQRTDKKKATIGYLRGLSVISEYKNDIDQ
jgi:hypothetical protein